MMNQLLAVLSRSKIDGRTAFAAVMLTVSVLAGQFALSRLALGLPEDLTRVRTLAIIAALIGFWPLIKRDWKKVLEPPFAAFGVLCLYLLGRGLFDHGEPGLAKATDIIVLMVQGMLVIVVARKDEARRAIAVCILACALLLVSMEIIAQFEFLTGKPAPFGFGWSSLIGSISFNRIEFLAFCVVLCILLAPGALSSNWLWALALVGVLTLFATWGSLQKSALIASLFALAGMVAGFVLVRRWGPVLIITGLAACAGILTNMVFGTHISGRFQGASKLSDLSIVQPHGVRVAQLSGGKTMSDAVGGSAVFMAASSTPVPTYGKVLPHQKSQGKISIEYCYFKSATLKKRQSGTPVLCYQRTLTDLTNRLPLAIEALRGFAASPVFGNGLASYRVEFIHPEVPVPDIYLYPHNLLLEVAFDGGTIGVALLIAAFAMAVFTAVKQRQDPIYHLPLLGFAGFMLFSVMFSGDFYDSRLLWLPLFMLISWQKHEFERFRDEFNTGTK